MSITIRNTSTTNTPPPNPDEIYRAIQNSIQVRSYSVNGNEIYRSMRNDTQSDNTEWIGTRGTYSQRIIQRPTFELEFLGNEVSIDKKRDDDIFLSRIKTKRNKHECPVCYNKKRLKIGLFQCEHLLCAACFTQMKKQICPICRADKTIY